MANIVLRGREHALLPDGKNHINRFKVRSETSGDEYIIAQHRTGRFWTCGCFGFIRWGKCKHLDALGLPGHRRPYEPLLEEHR
jgi:hypothetical protein